jgi:acyl-CoA thioester hydrolase
MTRTYRRRFLVRGYEIGATGRVHDSVFLHYVQQAAYEASSDAGYDIRRYNALGTVWVIRRQTIVYLEPLTYNDVVEVTTWVSDMRRVRSHREYELRRVSDERLVALARADWVYIDTATQFPRRIPQEAAEAFQANGKCCLDAAPPLEPTQEFEGRAFVQVHRVKSYELDNLRHANNSNYLNWLNQARLTALADVGFPLGKGAVQIQNLGLMPSPVRYDIEYFIPAVYGDQVEVDSQVVGVGETQLTWKQKICRGDERLVEARSTICFDDVGGESVPLPDALLDALGC